MAPLSRRDLIIGSSAALGGLMVGGLGVAASTGRLELPLSKPAPAARITFDQWVSGREAPYFIAHRGTSGVIPEHTMAGYLKAVESAAACIEIAVVMSSDRVLYCLQDRALGRTTTLVGDANSTRSAELDLARVSIPRLGPRWQGAGMPPVPRLRDVLDQIGGKAVLCIEPVGDSTYAATLDLIEELGLRDSVTLKLSGATARLESAKEAGYPVTVPVDKDVTDAGLTLLARRLDPVRDVIMLPSTAQALLSPRLVQAAAGTGVPTWVSPISRRFDAKYYSKLGVQGIVAPSVGYITESFPPARADDWSTDQLAPGELTRDPLSDDYAVTWVDEAALSLSAKGRQAFVTMGQFCPIKVTSYRISFDVRFDALPADTWQHVSISFAHEDDRYYEHRLGDGGGYHALLRADGHMGVSVHVEGDPNGRDLARAVQSTPLKPGVWARVTLDVTADGFQWSRDDGTTLSAADNRFRGGYFHIGRSSEDAKLSLRNLTVD